MAQVLPTNRLWLFTQSFLVSTDCETANTCCEITRYLRSLLSSRSSRSGASHLMRAIPGWERRMCPVRSHASSA
jgi:hypothetical protein